MAFGAEKECMLFIVGEVAVILLYMLCVFIFILYAVNTICF